MTCVLVIEKHHEELVPPRTSLHVKGDCTSPKPFNLARIDAICKRGEPLLYLIPPENGHHHKRSESNNGDYSRDGESSSWHGGVGGRRCGGIVHFALILGHIVKVNNQKTEGAPFQAPLPRSIGTAELLQVAHELEHPTIGGLIGVPFAEVLAHVVVAELGLNVMLPPVVVD